MTLLPLYSKTNPPPGEPTDYRWKNGEGVVAMWGPMDHESRCVDSDGQYTVIAGDYIVRNKAGGLYRVDELSLKEFYALANPTDDLPDELANDTTDTAESHSAPTTTPQED